MCFLIDKSVFLPSVYFKPDLKSERKECAKRNHYFTLSKSKSGIEKNLALLNV